MDLIYNQLLAGLRLLGRRLRLRVGVELLMRGAWVAFAACSLILLAGRLLPLDGYRLAAGGALALALLAWLAYSLARPLKPFAVARRADAELALRDRLSTALVLAAPKYRIPPGFNPTLVGQQVNDALSVLQSIEPRRAFPLRFERALVLRAAALLLFGVTLLVLPNPMDAVVAQREQVKQTAQEQARQLEKLAQQVEQDRTLTPKDQEALLKQLRELARQLKSNPGEAQKALADVAKFQEQLRANLDPAASSEAAALRTLAQQMAQLAGAPDKPRDGTQAAKLLEQLASQLNQMSPEQRESLAVSLDRAAAQAAGSNPGLARALSGMAQAARSNASGQQLQNATQPAEQALRDGASRQSAQQSLARALNQAETSQRALAQAAGQNNQVAQGNSANQGNQGNQGSQGSQGSQAGQGSPGNQGNQGGQGSPGQAQGQGNQVGGGGGTNARTLPPARRTGRAGSPTGPNKSYGTGDIDTVYSPITAGQGQQQFVAGQENPNGETTTRENQVPQPGANNSALVPYDQVYRQYVQIAGQTMDRSYVPADLQDFVKEYFSELEP